MNEKTPFENEIGKPEIENDTVKQSEREIEEIPEEKPEIGEESSWSKDQQEKSYYYDDSHGYEVYDPDEEDDDDEKADE